MTRLLTRPLHDFTNAARAALPDSPWGTLLAAFAALIAGWWLYVPLHELLHAFGCMATGGSVSRLEISPQYGAALLQKIFPFVAVGSDYAGQLTGFDTRGNDLIYLATVAAPYLLTVFIGVPLLRAVARAARPGAVPGALLGAALPPAYVPFFNAAGDYYEMGSILASRLAAVFVSDVDPARWRSDDLIKLAGELFFEGSFRLTDLVVVSLGFGVGLVLAFATYHLGVVVSDRFAGWPRG